MNKHVFIAAKKTKTRGHQHAESAATLRTAAVPAVPEAIRLLVNAACAARGGTRQMTLDDWRDVERELQRKFDREQPGRGPGRSNVRSVE